MVLKNKDGTPYRLASPNPVMKTQILWGNEKFILQIIVLFGVAFQFFLKPRRGNRDERPDAFAHRLAVQRRDAVLGHDIMHITA